MSAQRFPEDFDGILVGAPALDFSGTMIGYVWTQRALATSPIAHEKVKIIADKVYAKCDGIDGLTDGVIDDPRRCSFNPGTDLPRCAGDVDGPDCFTARQIETLERIYGGVISNGKLIFAGLPVGAEIAARGPTGLTTGWEWMVPKTGRSRELDFAETFLKYMAFGKPDPNYGPSSTDFFRLYMVPGMFHCGGGVGVSTFDALTPLVQWVEKGTAPEFIIGSRVVDGKVDRTRPLCPYPQVAKYKGSGSIDDASSFVCSSVSLSKTSATRRPPGR
jgi:feruloyl esterase